MNNEEPEIKNTRQASWKTLERDQVFGKFFRKEEKANAELPERNSFASSHEVKCLRSSLAPSTLNTEFL